MQICLRQYYETGKLSFSAYESLWRYARIQSGVIYADTLLAPCASLAQRFSACDACTQIESPPPFLEILKDHL